MTNACTLTNHQYQVQQQANIYQDFKYSSPGDAEKQQNTKFLVDIMLKKMSQLAGQQMNAPRDFSSSSTSSLCSSGDAKNNNHSNSHSMPNSSLDENENLISTKSEYLPYYDQKLDSLDYTTDMQSPSLIYSSSASSSPTSIPDFQSKPMLSHSIERILSHNSISNSKTLRRKTYF